MRILVCGSRHLNDEDLMFDVLSQYYKPGDVLIHGDAKGADRLSEKALRNTYSKFPVERYPADWNKHSKAAGPIRNQQMLDEGKPDLVIAFLAQDSRGTKDMISRAEKAGVEVKVINI